MSRFLIDLPNPYDPEAAWIYYGEYDSREEAVKAAEHHFGAVNGKLDLITELEDVETA